MFKKSFLIQESASKGVRWELNEFRTRAKPLAWHLAHNKPSRVVAIVTEKWRPGR